MSDLTVFSNSRSKQRAREAFGNLLARAEALQQERLNARIAELASPTDVRRWQRRVRRHLADILGPFLPKSLAI